jgi:hypothetical protein
MLTKSSGGTRGLGDRVVEDDSNMCRDHEGGVADMLLQVVWCFGSQNYWPNNFLVWASPVGVLVRMGEGMWCHREACIEVKQSCQEPVAIGCLDLKLDHFALGLSGSAKISKGIVESV